MGSSGKTRNIYIAFRTDVSEVVKNTEKAANSLKILQTAAKATGAVLGVVFASKAVSAVRGMFSEINKLAEAGDALSDVQNAFSRLGGSAASIDKARAATLGLVKDVDLLAEANRGLAAGVKGFDQAFPKIAELGARMAEAFKTDTKEQIDTLISGIIKGKGAPLQKLGFVFSDAKNRAVVMREALAQLDAQLSKYPALEDGVAEASTALANSWENLFERMGIGVQTSEELRVAQRQLAETIRQLDLEQLGKNLAEFEAVCLRIANAALPKLTEWLNNAAYGFALLFSNSKQIEADRLGLKLADLMDARKELDQHPWKPASVVAWGLGQFQGTKDSLDKQIAEVRSQWEAAENALHKPEAAKPPALVTGIIAGSAAAEKALEKLRDKIEAAEARLKESQAGLQMDEAIRSGNFGAFEQAKAALYEATREAVLQGYADAYDKLPDDLKSRIQALANAEADEKVKAEQDKWDESSKRRVEKMRQEFQDAAQLWTDVVTQVFQGGFDSLKQLMEQLAASFVGNVMAGLMGAPKGVSSLGGLMEYIGGSLAQAVIGGGAGGGANSGMIGGLIGGTAGASILGSFGTTAAEASAAGIAGPATASGMFAEGSGILGALGPYGVAALAGLAVLGSNSDVQDFAGKVFGFGGPRNPETLARKDITQKIDDLISAIGGLKIYGSDGKMTTLSGLTTGGSDAFNQPGWAEKMKAWGNDTAAAFTGLGDALNELYGSVENIGGQIGYILGENLQGDIDNARLAVVELGLSFDDLQKALLKAAETGKISWAQYNVDVAGLKDAFTPGLKAIGDYQKAWENLMQSGGTGMQSVKSIKDMAIEGIEAKLQTVQQLGAKLIAGGADPEFVNSMVDQLTKRGITSLEQMKNMSNEMAGSVVGDMELMSKGLSDKWQKIRDTLTDITTTINALPDKIEKTITINANIDPKLQSVIDSGIMSNGGSTAAGVQTHAFGGVVDSPTFFSSGGGLHLAGEAGPEAILPLRRIGGRLGVVAAGGAGGHSVSINIDARGAAPGVETEIRRVIADVQDEFVGAALSAVSNEFRRGGSFRGGFRR